MGKRKNRKEKQKNAPVPSKKLHVEKETSLTESCDAFIEARGQEVEKDSEMKNHLNLFVKTYGNVKTPVNVKGDSEEHLDSIGKAFQLIIQATLIHLTSHVDESLEALKDLLKSWTKSQVNKISTAKTHKSKVNKDDKREKEEEQDEIAWADVAVDAIISMLLTCNNRCLRLFLQGLKKLTNYTTDNIVDSICEPLIGVSDQVDEDEDGDGDDQSDAAGSEDSESDGEINEEMDEDESDDEDAWQDMEEDQGEGEEEKEEEVKELEKLRSKLHSILYSKSSGKSSESKSTATADDDDDESEDEVDDETMFALDDAIAAAFKEKFASKKSVLDEKEEVFKCRILKIIQCYTCQRERKSEILIPIALHILPLVQVIHPAGELKSRLIETLGEIFECKSKKIVPTTDDNLIEMLGQIFKLLIESAGKTKNSDESSLLSKGLNWSLKMDGSSKLTNTLAEETSPVTLTSNTFVSLSQNCSRATGLQLLKLMINGLISEEKDIQVKPLQLAHAFEIISHCLAKFVSNGQDELPENVCKQVWKIATDKANQLTGQLVDGKCNWLLLSSVLQALNYLKIIHAKNENNFFSPSDQLLESLGKITGKNRKKLPKAGQSALKNLLNVCKKKNPHPPSRVDEKGQVDENKTLVNADDSGKGKGAKVVLKSKIPVPKVKRSLNK